MDNVAKFDDCFLKIVKVISNFPAIFMPPSWIFKFDKILNEASYLYYMWIMLDNLKLVSYKM